MPDPSKILRFIYVCETQNERVREYQRKSERGWDFSFSIYWFTFQMAILAETETGQSQVSHVGNRVLNTWAIYCFPRRISKELGLREAERTATSAPIWDASVVGSSLGYHVTGLALYSTIHCTLHSRILKIWIIFLWLYRLILSIYPWLRIKVIGPCFLGKQG